MKGYKVLVLGKRKGLINALKELNIPFEVAHDYPHSTPENLESFTHILASGEGTVMLANSLREQLGLFPIAHEVINKCVDKLMMKSAAKAANIKVAKFIAGSTNLSSQEIYQELGNKVVVKDRNNSGGKGQAIFVSPLEIKHSENHLIESFVVGKEMSVESFIQKGEIKFVSTTKYQEVGITNIVPSDYSKDIIQQVLSINKKVIKAFNIQDGITHLEVYLCQKGKKMEVLFGEIALRPPGGHIMTLIKAAYGFNPWKAYIDIHLQRPLTIVPHRHDHAGAIVYHPGKGIVTAINGVEIMGELTTLESYKIKAKLGDQIDKRNGVGQEQAHFIFNSTDRQQLEDDILKVRENFEIKVSVS